MQPDYKVSHLLSIISCVEKNRNRSGSLNLIGVFDYFGLPIDTCRIEGESAFRTDLHTSHLFQSTLYESRDGGIPGRCEGLPESFHGFGTSATFAQKVTASDVV